MARINSTPSTKNIVDAEFESVKTMFEGFNTDRKLLYSSTDGHGEYGSGDPAVHGAFHVFITVPDLNLADSKNRGYLGIGNPFARHVLAEQLYRSGRLGSNFIKLFSNTAQNAPYQDITMDTTEYGENWDGVKLTTAKSSINSTQGGTVNLRFRDLAGNPVLNTLSIWYNYVEGVTKGFIIPKREHMDNRILDYAASMYVFTLGPDNSTIEYVAKYTGVFPSGVPAAAGTAEAGGNNKIIEIDAPFTFNFYEAMTGVILEDFNMSSKYKPMGKPDLSLANNVGSRGDILGNHAYLQFNDSIPFVSTDRPNYVANDMNGRNDANNIASNTPNDGNGNNFREPVKGRDENSSTVADSTQLTLDNTLGNFG